MKYLGINLIKKKYMHIIFVHWTLHNIAKKN